MSKKLRRKIADEFAKKYDGVDTFVVVEYRGLKSQQAADLRSHLKEGKVGMTVLKNRVAKRSFQKLGLDPLAGFLKGPTAIVWSKEDPAGVAKRLLAWNDKNKALVIKGGVVSKQPLDLAGVKALSQLPTREQMLGMTCGTIIAPLTGVAGCLNGVLAGFAGALAALEDKKKNEGQA